MKAIPNNITPVAKEPRIKYLMEASIENISFFLLPANMYKGIDKISTPRNSMDILEKDTSIKPPTVENKINA